MRKYVVPIGLCLLVSVMVSPAQEPLRPANKAVHQVSIPAIENYPKIPRPFGIMDFRQRARDFDKFVYAWESVVQELHHDYLGPDQPRPRDAELLL